MASPAARIDFAHAVQPERAAYSSGVRPPVGRYSVRDQQVDHLGESAFGGPHQRRLSAPRLDGVDVGTGSDELLRDFRRAGLRSQHQRGLAVAVRRFDVRAGGEQHLDDGGVRALHGFAQRARAVAVLRIRFSAVRQQLADERGVELVRGPVQRRRAVALRGVHVGAVLVNQSVRGFAAAVLDGVGERAFGRGECRSGTERGAQRRERQRQR